MYDIFSYLGWCYSKIGVCVCVDGVGGGVITWGRRMYDMLSYFSRR